MGPSILSCRERLIFSIYPRQITSNTSTVKKRKEKVVLCLYMMTDLELVEINSFVRGYHDYLDIWDATVGEVLFRESPTTVETFMQ